MLRFIDGLHKEKEQTENWILLQTKIAENIFDLHLKKLESDLHKPFILCNLVIPIGSFGCFNENNQINDYRTV